MDTSKLTPLPDDVRRAYVRTAIERIMAAQEKWRDVEADAESSSWQRMEANRMFNIARSDFSYQWENVCALLFSKPDIGPCDHEKQDAEGRYCKEVSCRNFCPF